MNSKNRILCVSMLLSALACASEGETPEAGRVSTELSGRLYAALRGEERSVRVLDLGLAEGGQEPSEACRTTSDGEGHWRCELGARSEAFRVEVTVAGAHPLVGWVTDVALGERRESVVLSPITHLGSAYAEYLVEHGVPRGTAVERMRKDVFGHFAGLRHDRVDPFDVVHERPRALAEDVVAGILLAGLERLASGLGSRGVTPTVDVWSLMDALAGDLRADGVFDGKGEGGRAVAVGGARLEAGLLREAYADALESWLVAERSRIGFGPDDLKGILAQIRTRASPIFPPLEAQVPEFESVTFMRNRDPLPDGTPVAGRVFVEVRFRAGGVAPEQIEVMGELESSSLALQTFRGGRFAINTHLLSDGPHVLKLVAMGPDGGANRLNVAFEVDNTPPELELAELGPVRGSTVTISGSCSDAFGVARLEIHPGAVVVDQPPQAFELAVPIVCTARGAISVTAYDAAGNAAHEQISVHCDQDAPSIRWVPEMFLQEGSLEPEFGPDGRILRWTMAAHPEELELGPGTAWPVTLEKYRHRLDAASANLPRLRWIIGEDESGVAVDYRYLLDGVERRGWTVLRPVAGNEYVLPISYETLSPELGGTTTEQLHRIEVRVQDATGNTSYAEASFHLALLMPPLWIGNCAPDPALRNFDLAAGTMPGFYGGSLPVLRAAIRYSVDGTSGGLDEDAATVRFSGGEVASTVHEFIDVRFDRFVVVEEPACRTGDHQPFDALGRPGACVRGLVPASREVPDVVVTQHGRRFVLTREGAPVLPSLGGAYSIEPNISYELSIIAEQPRLLIGGATIDWTRPDPQDDASYTHEAEIDSFVLPGVVSQGLNFPSSRVHDFRVHRYLGDLAVRATPIRVVASGTAPAANWTAHRARTCLDDITLLWSRASLRVR